MAGGGRSTKCSIDKFSNYIHENFTDNPLIFFPPPYIDESSCEVVKNTVELFKGCFERLNHDFTAIIHSYDILQHLQLKGYNINDQSIFPDECKLNGENKNNNFLVFDGSKNLILNIEIVETNSLDDLRAAQRQCCEKIKLLTVVYT